MNNQETKPNIFFWKHKSKAHWNLTQAKGEAILDSSAERELFFENLDSEDAKAHLAKTINDAISDTLMKDNLATGIAESIVIEGPYTPGELLAAVRAASCCYSGNCDPENCDPENCESENCCQSENQNDNNDGSSGCCRK
jgi:hypothetical protein